MKQEGQLKRELAQVEREWLEQLEALDAQEAVTAQSVDMDAVPSTVLRHDLIGLD